MPDTTLPPAIASLIDATNNGDDDAFVGAFTTDAHVEDGGRAFEGHDGVARWNLTDNIGVGMIFTLVSWESAGPHAYVVTLRSASRRFSGTGTMQITVQDDLIASLIIG